MNLWKAIKNVAFAATVCCAIPVLLYTPKTHEVTYHVPVESGDTIYDIASRIATSEDNINQLAWRIRRDNHIEDPGELQPGTELIVTVERRK